MSELLKSLKNRININSFQYNIDPNINNSAQVKLLLPGVLKFNVRRNIQNNGDKGYTSIARIRTKY